MRFRAVIQLGGKTATGIPVPSEIVARLGPSKRPAVRVAINGHTYRSTVAPLGGAFMLPLSAEHRASAGVAAGDEVEVDLERDTAPREVACAPHRSRNAVVAEKDARPRRAKLRGANDASGGWSS